MATDLVGVAAVIGASATFVSTTALVIRSFMPNRRDDDYDRDDYRPRRDDEGNPELADLIEKRRHRRAHTRRSEDDGRRLLAWIPRRKAIA